MKVVAIIICIVLGAFVCWFVYDTIKFMIKKFADKKKRKKAQQEEEIKEVDTTKVD